MPTSLLHHLGLCTLLALPCLLSACGPDLTVSDDGGEATDDGGEPVVHANEPLPPIDLDAWCDDPDALPPFADQGPVSRLEEQGPCGHLLTWYFDGESIDWTLWYPDGSVEALGTAPRVESDMFSPTGRLLAWAEGEDDGAPTQRVTIRDLQAGGSRTIETQGPMEYGFVRIPDSDPGAVLWLCHGNVLELVGVELDDPRVLAEDVRCETVSGGELSTRLVYADLDDVVSVVDTRDANRWSTGVGDAEWPRLSPDGRLAFDYPKDPSGTPHRVVDLDRGEVVASCESVRFFQALASATPLFVLCDGELSVWSDDALEPVLDGVAQATSVAPTTDGSATFRRQIGEERELWFVPAEGPSDAQLIVSLPDALPILYRSRNGQHGRLSVETSECADANCSETITEVRTWTPAGLGASMSVAGDWKHVHVFEDGQALGYGSPIEGPLPEGVPIPEPQLVLSGPDGVPTDTWSIDGEVWGTWPLDDERLLLHGHYGVHDYVLMFDRDAPVVETLLGPVEYAIGHRLDPRLGLLAFTIEADGPDRLYWGGVPD